MNTMQIKDELQAQLGRLGYRAGFLSADIVENLNERFEKDLKGGLINPDVYREYMKSFDFNLPADLPDARSIIVVAVPQPCVEVVFSSNGKKLPGIIPPTYSHINDPEVEKILSDLFTPRGYSVTRTKLPLKLLAVHSGLAKYGKNNVAYVEGMGSYLRLMAFWSDLPSPNNHWHELQALEECTDCKACLRKCPTGAISADSFQVSADRCLTFFNELTTDFPSWIDPSWHHCLVGCLYCQKSCPVNKDVKDWTVKSVEFSAEETALLLDSPTFEDLPVGTKSKLEKIELNDSLDTLPRNLGLLIDGQTGANGEN